MTQRTSRRASWIQRVLGKALEVEACDEAENKTILQGFEWNSNGDGNHYDRLHDALPNLKAIGIDNLWLPPGCKATSPGSNGYDIYDLYDLGEFDTHGNRRTKWGQKEQLQRLCARANELDIGLYWDAVLNHRSGADHKETVKAVEVHPMNRLKEITKPRDIEAWVGFDFPARGDKYSSQKYNQSHFTAADWDDRTRRNAIYRFANKSWSPYVNRELGNFDFLLLQDMDLAHPEVIADTKNWGVWITRELNLSGFRLDAAKHMSARFIHDWITHVRKESGKDLFIVGEYCVRDGKKLAAWIRKMGRCLSLIDDPLFHNLSRTSRDVDPDLRRVVENSLVLHEPNHAVTYVDSHDVQPGRNLPLVLGWFKPHAHALILLMRSGHPCIFFGDLYGRLDPDGGGPSCSNKLPTLLLARKLFAYGPQDTYFDARDCVGFVRRGARNRPAGLACVLRSAGERGTKRMFVGEERRGEVWRDLMEGVADVRIDERGWGDFGCLGRSVSVFVNRQAEGLDRFPVAFDAQFYK